MTTWISGRSPPALTAITSTRPTPADPMATPAPSGSPAASSLVQAHGSVGRAGFAVTSIRASIRVAATPARCRNGMNARHRERGSTTSPASTVTNGMTAVATQGTGTGGADVQPSAGPHSGGPGGEGGSKLPEVEKHDGQDGHLHTEERH